MKISTLNAIINSFHAASDDPSRYNLNCVRIKAYGQHALVEATDGHILSSASIEDSELCALMVDREYFVSRDALPGLKALAKAFKNLNGVASTLSDNNNLELKGPAGTVVIECQREANITFPNVDAVKPKYSDDCFSVSLNPELLMSLLKAMRDDNKTEMATLTFKGSMDPIVVEVSGQHGVLMPMRGPKTKTEKAA